VELVASLFSSLRASAPAALLFVWSLILGVLACLGVLGVSIYAAAALMLVVSAGATMLVVLTRKA
jgi:hypothetical protein